MAGALKSLRWYRDLADRKGRKEAGAFLVEGERAIRQIKTVAPENIMEILSTAAPPGFLSGYPARTLTDRQFRSISSTETPQGLTAVILTPPDTYTDRLPPEPGNRILLLEDIQDPGNVGTLIRTAAAFRFTGVILSDKCADPLSPKVVQATAGTVLSVWLRRTDHYLDLAAALRERQYCMLATTLDGREDIALLSSRSRLVLALGNEAAGLSTAIRAAADCRLKIPIAPERAESLNVAACGAICMYLIDRGD
jgi:TrmH family RNA methyltransferase